MDEDEDDTATPIEVGCHPMSDTDEDDVLLAAGPAWRTPPPADGLLPGSPDDGEDMPNLADIQALYMSWTAWCMYFCRIAGRQDVTPTTTWGVSVVSESGSL